MYLELVWLAAIQTKANQLLCPLLRNDTHTHVSLLHEECDASTAMNGTLRRSSQRPSEGIAGTARKTSHDRLNDCTLQHSVGQSAHTTTYGQHTTAFRTGSQHTPLRTVSTLQHSVRTVSTLQHSIRAVSTLQHSTRAVSIHHYVRTVSTLQHSIRAVSTHHYVQSAHYSIPYGQSAHTTKYG